MIKGDINNVISWLDMNGIQQWTIYQGSGANGQGKLFESNIELPKETEIERFREVMGLSENTLVKIVGKVNPKQNTGVFTETWTNASAPSHSMSIGAAPIFDADYIDKKVKAAVAEERLLWREKELAKRESALDAAEKEFRQAETGVWGVIVNKAAPLLSSILPKAAVAGISTPQPAPAIPVREFQSVPESGTSTIETECDAPGVELKESAVEEEVFTDDEATRLFAAMAKFKDADPEYLEVVEGLVNYVTSGEPLSVFGAKIDYNMVKNVILKR